VGAVFLRCYLAFTPFSKTCSQCFFINLLLSKSKIAIQTQQLTLTHTKKIPGFYIKKMNIHDILLFFKKKEGS